MREKLWFLLQGVENKMKAGNKLQSALKSIFAISENYPDLKAKSELFTITARTL